jgi:hypothetical protein
MARVGRAVGDERTTCADQTPLGKLTWSRMGLLELGEDRATEWGYTARVDRAVGDERTACCPTKASSHGATACEQET